MDLSEKPEPRQLLISRIPDTIGKQCLCIYTNEKAPDFRFRGIRRFLLVGAYPNPPETHITVRLRDFIKSLFFHFAAHRARSHFQESGQCSLWLSAALSFLHVPCGTHCMPLFSVSSARHILSASS